MFVSRRCIRALLLGSTAIVPWALFSATADANPKGGTVEAGAAQIEEVSPTTLRITQQTEKAIINWESFDIGEQETTRFVLPNSSSVTLNRDFSGNPSEILGRLESNGRFFLVNPSGILFGRNATIDVAGLVATTHDIESSDFMSGNYDFSIPGEPGASVINEGSITVDDLGFGAFVAPHVRNDGAILARMGKVEMASASGFTLDMHGDRLISFLIENPNDHEIYNADGEPISALVENSGSVVADGGQVVLSASAARGVVDSVINTDGIIQANTVAERGGRIILGGGGEGVVRTSGTVAARGDDQGETGGKIVATGEHLLADAFAHFDVTGWSGGGRLLFGGDYLGGNTTNDAIAHLGIELEDEPVETASVAVLEDGARVSADAITSGDGGKLILWADDALFTRATLSAKGGTESGDGGFIETSAAHLSFDGSVDVSATNGSAGTWLIDPLDITIDERSEANARWTPYIADWDLRDGGDFEAISIEATREDAVLPVDAIENTLNNGNNVVVTTFGTIGPDRGDIRLRTDITKRSGGDARLSLYADDDIFVDDGVDVRARTGDLVFDLLASGDDIRASDFGVLDLNGGTLILQAADDIRFKTDSNMPDYVTLIMLNDDTSRGTVDVQFDDDVVEFTYDDEEAVFRPGAVQLVDRTRNGGVSLLFEKQVDAELYDLAWVIDFENGRYFNIFDPWAGFRGIGINRRSDLNGTPEFAFNLGIPDIRDQLDRLEDAGEHPILEMFEIYAGGGLSSVGEGALNFEGEVDFYVVTDRAGRSRVVDLLMPPPPPAPEVRRVVKQQEDEEFVTEAERTSLPSANEVLNDGDRGSFQLGRNSVPPIDQSIVLEANSLGISIEDLRSFIEDSIKVLSSEIPRDAAIGASSEVVSTIFDIARYNGDAATIDFIKDVFANPGGRAARSLALRDFASGAGKSIAIHVTGVFLENVIERTLPPGMARTVNTVGGAIFVEGKAILEVAFGTPGQRLVAAAGLVQRRVDDYIQIREASRGILLNEEVVFFDTIMTTKALSELSVSSADHAREALYKDMFLEHKNSVVPDLFGSDDAATIRSILDISLEALEADAVGDTATAQELVGEMVREASSQNVSPFALIPGPAFDPADYFTALMAGGRDAPKRVAEAILRSTNLGSYLIQR